MDNVSFTDVQHHVRKWLDLATAAADSSECSEDSHSVATFGPFKPRRDVDPAASKPIGWSVNRWATILFADLRNACQLPATIGERNAFLSMHALVHGLSCVVPHFGGQVVGFRGDGLVVAFGIDSSGATEQNVDRTSEVLSAVKCGKALIEVIEGAVCPELRLRKISEPLRIGIGVDADDVAISTVGHHNTCETIAYGRPVSKAACFAEKAIGDVFITVGAKQILTGKNPCPWGFTPVVGLVGAWCVEFAQSPNAVR